MTERRTSGRIGDRTVHVVDDKNRRQTMKEGVAETHEQVSDTYTAGTSDGATSQGGATAADNEP